MLAVAGATIASGFPIGVAASQVPAGAEAAQVADDSACPSSPNPRYRDTDPLVGPIAEDDYSEPTEPEIPESQDLAAAQPNSDLQVQARAPNSEVGAAAAADVQARVHLGSIRWCVVQPTDPNGPAGAVYNWDPYDEVIDRYLAAGVQIHSIKIVDAPDWAGKSGCVAAAAADENPKWCPPRAGRDPDLRAFARKLAKHYGPGPLGEPGEPDYEITRISFWNEPNLAPNWGRKEYDNNAQRQTDAEQYSDRLKAFYAAATSANPDVKIDAGEVAAGGSQAKGNGVRKWADFFADYSQAQNPGSFNGFTIHAYSEFPYQIMRKVENYRALPGVTNVGVTEFGWAVERPFDGEASHWKCTGSETGSASQADYFQNVVTRVRDSSTPLGRLVWFNLLDNRKGEEGNNDPKCQDAVWYSENESYKLTNTYGLYKRKPDSTASTFADLTARPLRDAFICAQPQPPASC